MAHWIKPRKEGVVCYGEGYTECSNCHKKVWLPSDYAYCPYCGEMIDNIITKGKNWIKVTEELPAE